MSKLIPYSYAKYHSFSWSHWKYINHTPTSCPVPPSLLLLDWLVILLHATILGGIVVVPKLLLSAWLTL